MKKFNQMTEKQMSQVNGGFVGIVFGIIALAAGIAGTAYGSVKASQAIDKAAGK